MTHPLTSHSHGRRLIVMLTGLVVLATLVVGLAGVGLGQVPDGVPAPGQIPGVTTPGGSVPDGAPARDQPPGVDVTDPANLDKHPKMEGILAATARTVPLQGDDAALDLARASGVAVVGSAVRVIVESVDPDPSAARAVVLAAGGVVEGEYANAIQALLPPSALEQVANDPAVQYVRTPARGVPNNVGR
jgi:hypothetical protein